MDQRRQMFDDDGCTSDERRINDGWQRNNVVDDSCSLLLVEQKGVKSRVKKTKRPIKVLLRRSQCSS